MGGESCLEREIIVGRVTPSLIFIYLLSCFVSTRRM